MPYKDPENQKKHNQDYYQKHKEEIRKQQKEYAKFYYLMNPDYNEKYYQVNKERMKEQMRIWRETHKEQKRELDRKYRLEHLNERRKYDAKYGLKHKEQQKERSKKWYLNHPDLAKELDKKWKIDHPNEWREIQARNEDKRRGLGSISINKWFKGSHRHHYDKEHIIFIPKELHKSYHNVWTRQNIKIVNDKAFKWLIEHGDSTQTFISSF